MHLLNNQNAVGGAILVAIGVFVGAYADLHYDIGTLRQFGPGMVPFALGFVLAIIGALVFAEGVVSAVEIPKIVPRPLLVILAATAMFALTIDSFGLVPATFLATIISTFAEPKPHLVKSLALSAGMAVLVLCVFRYGLGVQVRPIRWPF